MAEKGKLEILADIEGYEDTMELLEAASTVKSCLMIAGII